MNNDNKKECLGEIDNISQGAGEGTISRTTTAPFKGMTNKILYFLTITGPDLLLAGIMTAILVGIALFDGGTVRFFQASLGLPIGIMLFLLLYQSILKHTRKGYEPKRLMILRDWIPFLLVTFIYENLHDFSKLYYEFDIAQTLYEWDIILFGVEPTLWIQKFYSPLLTDIMAVSYALYFFLPLVIMLFLSQEEKRYRFRHITLTLTFSFLLGFAGYVFLPASPPRYFITELYTNPVTLHGPLIFDRLQAAWDGLSVVPCGAFPSLHVGISTVALIYAWKFRNLGKIYKWIWYLYIPLVTSLWVSTVYLRHHWVIDIFAGWFVAIFAYFISDIFLKVWKNLRTRYGLSL